jgi:RNA polymerase sigma-70 factor, ECF subfamily
MLPASQSPQVAWDPIRLIETHQAGVWRYLRVLGCDASLADDLTQETFVRVLERPFEEINDAATSAYLRRTAHNLFVTLKRKEGKVAEIERIETLAGEWSRWAERDNGEELLLALRQCLAALTDRARMALEMRFGEQQTRAAIAAALEITEHGAKNLMQRAKQQLRACIEGKLS